MEAHVHFRDRVRGHVPHLHLVHRETGYRRLALVGAGGGALGMVVLALPLVVYDWVKASHTALELPMATTGWLFGLDHFARNGYHWWPIVIGAIFLLAYGAIQGAAFAGLAERVYRIRGMTGALALGAAWSFVDFMFFWYMLLPIARDGAPFRTTAGAPTAYVAGNWVWILAFTLCGLATAIAYRTFGARTTVRQTADAREQQAA